MIAAAQTAQLQRPTCSLINQKLQLVVANLKDVCKAVRVPSCFTAQMLKHHRKVCSRAVKDKRLFKRAQMIQKVLLGVRVSRHEPVESALQTLRYSEMNDHIVDVRCDRVQHLFHVCVKAN